MTSPKARDTTPMIAKWIGCMPTFWATGARRGPAMMIAGTASMKHPITRNTAASMSPTLVGPAPYRARKPTTALGI